jgi:hypothetical protein
MPWPREMLWLKETLLAKLKWMQLALRLAEENESV